MKNLAVRSLALEGVLVIRFERFRDHRGYFTEHYRKGDFDTHPDLACFREMTFVQANESFSRAGTIRGLHFQWNPYMGKLVRTVQGRMVDMVLDIRKGSPTYGKIICHDMPARPEDDAAEWIWVPPGFAHGNFFTEDTTIEYFCTGQYSPGCEAGISPLAEDIDWGLCDPGLCGRFRSLTAGDIYMTEKDRNGFTVAGWAEDKRSDLFTYGKM